MIITMFSEETLTVDFNLATVSSMDEPYHPSFYRYFGLVVLPWFPVASGFTDRVAIGTWILGDITVSIDRYKSVTSASIHREE